jgi:hypothetical protein
VVTTLSPKLQTGHGSSGRATPARTAEGESHDKQAIDMALPLVDELSQPKPVMLNKLSTKTVNA